MPKESNSTEVVTMSVPSMRHDAVNHPSHYTQGDVECIDAIKSALGDVGFGDYCRGQIFKYVWRANHKNGVEDLRKANYYMTELLKLYGV